MRYTIYNFSSLNSKITTIGTTVIGFKGDQSINANNSTAYASNSITLDAGTWMIFGAALISKGVANVRQGFTITTSNTSGTFNGEMYELRLQNADTSNNQYYNVSGSVSPSAQTTYYAMIFNGNIAANVTTWLRAVRVK